MGKLLRLWHTVRYLRAVQIWGRLWFLVYRPRVSKGAAPKVRARATAWRSCRREPRMTGPMRFRFLGVERDVADAGDWQRKDVSRLWRYNLHYFDDLAADGAAQRMEWHRSAISRWVNENPVGEGSGWEPYPTSLRIVNWVKWAMAGAEPTAEFCQSLAVQARWLRKRLEVHLQGNHLWANAKALMFAGLYFEGPEADGWRLLALRLLRRELSEQVLADGGHFERSPMYHAIVLEDLVDLVQADWIAPGLVPAECVAAWRTVAARMHRWLRVMSHPDGGIAFFNDAALGVGPECAALGDYAAAVGIPIDRTALAGLEALPESGYVRATAGPAVLIVDVAQIGPDYLPGHAHADTLSFELSLAGGRALVNGGTSTYEPGGERMRQRSTAAHNTVVIDGQDSSEIWAAFRVARRARPLDPRWGSEPDGRIWAECSHDGYLRLPGRVVHRRRWVLDSKGLEIEDRIDGRWHDAAAGFHVAPGWRVAADATLADNPEASTRLRWSYRGGGSPRVEEGRWHPRFGESLPCSVIRVPISRSPVTTTISWS